MRKLIGMIGFMAVLEGCALTGGGEGSLGVSRGQPHKEGGEKQPVSGRSYSSADKRQFVNLLDGMNDEQRCRLFESWSADERHQKLEMIGAECSVRYFSGCRQ